MTLGGIPTIQVLLDDGTGTFPFDITAFVRFVDGIDIARGRQDQISDVVPGQMTLTLENADGRFTFGSTIIASPSPIGIDSQIRVKYTANATVVNRHTGYLSGLPVNWPTGGDLESRVIVTATDAEARAARRTLRSVPEEEILRDSPIAYYTLGEPAGATTSVDSSGNQKAPLLPTGSGAPIVYGTATGPGTDGLTAATFAGGQFLSGGPPVPVGAVLECFFSRSGLPSLPEALFVIPFTPPGLGPPTGVAIGTDGKLTTDGGDLAGPVVTDGGVHHLSWQTGHVLLDGVDIGSPTNAPFAGPLRVGGQGPSDDFSVFVVVSRAVVAFNGGISHVSEFTSLSTTRAAQHAAAGLTGFSGEADTARMIRSAGYAAILVGTLDASLTNVPFIDITNTTAYDQIKAVSEGAFGFSYIDGSGNLTFHNRNRPVLKVSPDVTFPAEFLDQSVSFAVDTQGVYNYFETTSQTTQVKQVARNVLSEYGNGTASHPGHGRYPTSMTYLVSTDAEALDRANWIISNQAEPSPRAGTLTLDLLTMTAAQQATALAIEADAWVQITGLPAQAPSGTTGDFIVQGIADKLTYSSWTLTLNVVSRSMYSPVWILDDTTYSVLDTTTRLFV